MKKLLLMTLGLTTLVLAASLTRNPSTGVVSDATSGLQWQDETNATAATWLNAITYCEGLTLDNGGWRLPNINELTSIVDDRRVGPSISNVFLYTDSTDTDYYWTSTTNEDNVSTAWRVRFVAGDHWYGDKNVTNKVRCVR